MESFDDEIPHETVDLEQPAAVVRKKSVPPSYTAGSGASSPSKSSSKLGRLTFVVIPFIVIILALVGAIIGLMLSRKPNASSSRGNAPSSSPVYSSTSTTATTTTSTTTTQSPPTGSDPGWLLSTGVFVVGKNHSGFGTAMSISGDGKLLAVGAPGDGFNDLKGSVDVLELVGDQWVLRGAPLEWNNGTSVALSRDGQTIVVASLGYANAYRYNEDDQLWKRFGLTIEISNDVTSFGSSVLNDGILGYFTCVDLSHDGSKIALGEPYTNIDDRGHVRVMTPHGNGGWAQVGSTIVGRAPHVWAGMAVSMSGDGSTLAVGAPAAFGDVHDLGYVEIFRLNDDETDWKPHGRILEGTELGDGFGSSVALSVNGDTVAVGAPFHGDNRVGRIHVFRYDANAGQFASLGNTIVGMHDTGELGWSVSLSDDGNTVASGAPGYGFGKETPASSNHGMAAIYDFDDTKHVWSQKGTQLRGMKAYDYLGTSVVLSGDASIIAVGAPSYGTNGYVAVFHEQ